MDRTVLLRFAGTTADQQHRGEFRVESWFMPIDGPVESLRRVVLVWDGFGAEVETVVLLGPKRLEELAAMLQSQVKT